MAIRRTTDREVLAQIPEARARARRAAATEPHASAATYDSRSKAVVVQLTNGGMMAIPIALLSDLSRVDERDLAGVEVGPAGLSLRWESLDVDLSVVGLARLLLGSRTLMRAAGATGGAARSSAKGAAARLNGRKGGRPKKRER